MEKISPPHKPAGTSLQPTKGSVQPLNALAEAFCLSKRVAGCTQATLDIYRLWLVRFCAHVGDHLDGLTVQRFFADLVAQGLSASRVHQAYRTVKTYLRWLLATGALSDDPLRGFRLRTPKTLPQVPTEDELQAVLRACSTSTTGRRNRAMILLMADAGLRASELVRLLVEHWTPAGRSLLVRGGKGRKDRVTFVTPTTARALREYLGSRRLAAPEDFLFVDVAGRPLTRSPAACSCAVCCTPSMGSR